jgi:hypothetical protein
MASVFIAICLSQGVQSRIPKSGQLLEAKLPPKIVKDQFGLGELPGNAAHAQFAVG